MKSVLCDKVKLKSAKREDIPGLYRVKFARYFLDKFEFVDDNKRNNYYNTA